MEKTQMIHNGVSKKVYATDEPDKVIIQYTDAITAYYKIKKALIKDKGLYCNAISSMIFKLLADSGVPVHFIERIDLCYKSEDLGEPLINDSHAIALGLVNKAELAEIYRLTRKINDVLVPVFRKIGITLVDFKIEFGRLPDGPFPSRQWKGRSGLQYCI